MTIPLLALLGLAVPVVYDRVQLANRANDLDRKTRAAATIAALIQEIQLERVYAVGYKIGQVSRPTVEQQIDSVNSQVEHLLAGSVQNLNPQLRVDLSKINELADIRGQILTGKPDWAQVVTTYDDRIRALINDLALEDDIDLHTSAGRQIVGLDAVLRSDEQISLGASLLILVASDTEDELLFVQYQTVLVQLNQQGNRLTLYATPEQLALYTELQENLTKQLGGAVALAPGSDPRGALQKDALNLLYPRLRDFLKAALAIERKIVNDVLASVTQQRNSALTSAYSVGTAALLILILVALLSAAVARAVVRPLTRLTASANRVSRVAQSELVRIADDQAESTGVVHLDPVDVRARDEVGDLARAFEEVQGTAVALVQRQVASRRNVAQMFGHIGRRTQNLVARQIALIDWLEREESDPARLQQLYRLDHVSSRLRRNAQSLVVLSGGDGANPHLSPLPLGDVVRLALGEIEDYNRVDVDVASELVVGPAAISDLVLILAELMENATAFSPPQTRVTVTGQALPHGAARIVIVDHGLGLSPERMAEENTRLTRPERLDLTPTEVLGLFVVGRLARRQGVEVTLLATQGGGVTAAVGLPTEALIPALLAASSMATTSFAAPAAPRRSRPGRSRPVRWPAQRSSPAARRTRPKWCPGRSSRYAAPVRGTPSFPGTAAAR